MFGTVGHSTEAKDNAVLIKWQTVALSGLEMQCNPTQESHLGKKGYGRVAQEGIHAGG